MILGITSGCFDLVHHGHVVYLERCKALCDYLVVGVDSDRMVRKVKGEERPIIPAEQRLLMVEALKPVDEVFELKSLRGLEAKVRAVPDTFTEVRMFKHEGFADMDHVVGVSGTRAELVIVPDVPGLVSTTEIVNRIKGLNPRREWTYSDVKMLKALWDRRCAGERRQRRICSMRFGRTSGGS